MAGEDLPPPPRQERSRRKREALLQAGLSLFAERGYESTTVEEVAERAEVAVGSFYQHFRSKRQLLLVLMDRLLDEVTQLNFIPAPEAAAEQIEQLASLAAVMPRALVTQAVRSSLSLNLDYAGVHRAWGEAISRDPGLERLDREIEDWTASLAIRFFQGVYLLPGVRKDVDVPSLAWLVTLLFWKLAGRRVAHSEAVVRSMADLIYHAFLEDPVPSAASLPE